jgi:hypothetical protein
MFQHARHNNDTEASDSQPSNFGLCRVSHDELCPTIDSTDGRWEISWPNVGNGAHGQELQGGGIPESNGIFVSVQTKGSMGKDYHLEETKTPTSRQADGRFVMGKDSRPASLRG